MSKAEYKSSLWECSWALDFVYERFPILIYHFQQKSNLIGYCLTLSTGLNFLLMTFANSLDPDQAPQNIVPDLDPNHTNLVFVNKKEKNIHFEKKNQQTFKLLIFGPFL